MHRCTQGGEGGRGVNMDPQADFKRLANKNAIKPKIGDPKKFGTRSFDRITFFRNSKFSFEFHSFEIFLFFSFFRIRVLSKKKIISKDNRTKNNLYK